MCSSQVIFKDKQFFLQLYNPTNLFSAKENMQIVRRVNHQVQHFRFSGFVIRYNRVQSTENREQSTEY